MVLGWLSETSCTLKISSSHMETPRRLRGSRLLSPQCPFEKPEMAAGKLINTMANVI